MLPSRRLSVETGKHTRMLRRAYAQAQQRSDHSPLDRSDEHETQGAALHICLHKGGQLVLLFSFAAGLCWLCWVLHGVTNKETSRDSSKMKKNKRRSHFRARYWPKLDLVLAASSSAGGNTDEPGRESVNGTEDLVQGGFFSVPSISSKLYSAARSNSLRKPCKPVSLHMPVPCTAAVHRTLLCMYISHLGECSKLQQQQQQHNSPTTAADSDSCGSAEGVEDWKRGGWSERLLPCTAHPQHNKLECCLF